jgi:hypothetical protein
MTNEELDPIVPVLPQESTAVETIVSDGGRPERYDREDQKAPLVADLR